MKLLSFGEILWDIYPAQKYLGGAPLNFAAHFSKHGGEAYMVSAVGRDSLGQAALEQLTAWRVNPAYIAQLEGKETGQCLVQLDEHGVPSYTIKQDVAYDYIDSAAVADGFDALYFGSLALRSEHNRQELMRLINSHRFPEVFVDVNVRQPFVSRESLLICTENATVLKISDEELPLFSGEVFGREYDSAAVVKKLASTYGNLNVVIVTRGAQGSLAYDCRSNRTVRCDAEPVTVASTVGAGDSFSAAFLYRYMAGWDIPRCLKAASRVSAYVVSRTEAVPEYDARTLQG